MRGAGYAICQRCSGYVPMSSHAYELLVCPHCGWILNSAEGHATRSAENSSAFWTLFYALLFIGGIVHAMVWNEYSLKVIPLKVKFYAEKASIAELQELGQVCFERNRMRCITEVYERIIKIDPTDLSSLAYLGQTYANMGQYSNAKKTFDQYFETGGRDPEVFFEIAKNYRKLGDLQQAEKFFVWALAKRSSRLHVAVVRDYVSMLIEMGRLYKAKSIIERTRRMGMSMAAFMDPELRSITKKLKSDRS